MKITDILLRKYIHRIMLCDVVIVKSGLELFTNSNWPRD